jgi:hypothetical protein
VFSSTGTCERALCSDPPKVNESWCYRLWGNPSHLQYVCDALRARYDSSVLQILVVKRNAGRNTYDGIETGGERVAKEIENALEDYARDGAEIRKISIVGYSLGGFNGVPFASIWDLAVVMEIVGGGGK